MRVEDVLQILHDVDSSFAFLDKQVVHVLRCLEPLRFDASLTRLCVIFVL